ncbi:hypothetical protein HGRIS_008308 [Hohenbuehelia grisea]|uniref:Uncharacterized protein n=1 Tax=Hohenbuehelia grisea TaxID=104357 RepID=A0ABR3J7U5_9AGAR
MSLLQLGANDVTEEAQAFKDHLASKESRIAAQEDKITLQAAKLEELTATLNEAIQKLNHESQRAIQLEDTLARATEDLRNEKVSFQNVQIAMSSTHVKLKEKESDIRGLYATIESLSHKSDEKSNQCAQLEREKSTLYARIKELETNVRQLSSSQPITPPSRIPTPRSRSSSISNVSPSLEKDLQETRLALSQKEKELRDLTLKFTQVQESFVRSDNERIAAEKRLTSQVTALESALEDKDEELEFLRSQGGDGTREEQLLQRIEEDGAKIEELEKLVADASRAKGLQEKLRKAEARADELAAEYEGRHIELVMEREDALDKLHAVQSEVKQLSNIVREKEEVIEKLETTAPSSGGVIDEATAAHVERLLGAITRLRGERDDFKRDFEFLETESKFTIESLEAQLFARSSSSSTSRTPSDSALIQRRASQIRSLYLTTSALATVVQHSESRLDSLALNLDQSEVQLRNKDAALSQMESGMKASVQQLEGVVAERDTLLVKVQSTADEWSMRYEELMNNHRDTRSRLEETQVNLANVSKELEDADSERNSLKVQVTNLNDDIAEAQAELANAESRYSALQLHQLSDMSSNEAVSALREQIEELEGRVMRRTEQIGIHQHDIKRLEANLRLQEERLAEMTMEGETLVAEKEAMVEDCAAAREARDEARQRMELLELEVENMEVKVEQGDEAIVTLVAVIADMISKSRDAIRACEERAAHAQGEVQTKLDHTEDELNRLAAAHTSTLQELADKVVALERLSEESSETLRNLCITLAISRAESARVAGIVHALQANRSRQLEEKAALEEQSASQLAEIERLSTELKRLHAIHEVCSRELEQKTALEEQGAFNLAEIDRLSAELKEVRADQESQSAQFASQKAELEVTVGRLEAEALSVQESHQDALKQLELRHAELQARLDEVDGPDTAALRAELDELRVQYSSIQVQVDEATRALEEALQARDAAETAAKEGQETSAQRIAELEGRQAELTKEREEQKAELATLQQRLDNLQSDVQTKQEALDALRTQSAEERSSALKDFDQRLAEAREESTKTEAELQADVAHRSQELEELNFKLTRLEERLRTETDDWAHTEGGLKSELAKALEKCQQADSSRDEAVASLTGLREELVRTQDDLSSTQQEKDSLQIEITSLEAEIQRSLSLRRFMENRAQESERNIASLSETLEQVRADLSQTEKRAQAAEMNLSLQSAHHKRELADLQKELAALHSRPDMDSVVAELEERNNEMEELLRAKCAEIEDNDDRVLELLKDNKKLTARVESLTRKVQNLQTKLNAAKASGTPPPPPPVEPAPVAAPPSQRPSIANGTPETSSLRASTSRSRSNTSTSTPSLPPVPAHVAFPSSSSSVSLPRFPSTRTASTPVVPSRSKTLERKSPPVFSMRTPERPPLPVEAEPPSSGIGKKRRVPEEWEAENVPPQAYSADSVPDNRTPRARRVLESIHSSFTPVRHSTARTEASPKRFMSMGAKTSPTKSPRRPSQPASEAKVKRSWLGKIRGVSSQATGGRPASSSRPVYEQDGFS